jgi:hypothetical protein
MNAFDMYKLLVNGFTKEIQKKLLGLNYNGETEVFSFRIGNTCMGITKDGELLYNYVVQGKEAWEKDVSKTYSGL